MYRILSVTLKRFRRMLLNEIHEITITPAAAVQLILGTNGCGKSSLLEQLTPLPAETAAFTKGGSKVVDIESHGRHFVCASYFDHGAEHSFVMDGEELNPGGTAQVQRDLCKKYFNVTPDTHDLIRGVEKFTLMNPAKRREWMMTLCDSDYEFALNAYDKLKERANLLTGAAKMNKKNLVTETAKIMSDAEEKKLEEEVRELLNELKILQEERMPLTDTSANYLEARTRALRTLDEVSMRLLRNRVVVPYEYTDGEVVRDEWGQLRRAHFTSMDEIDKEIDRLKHLATHREGILVTKTELFTKLERQYDILMKTGAEGVESLIKQTNSLREQMKEKTNKLRLGLLFHNAKAALEAFESIETPLTDILREIPINSDRRYGRARHQELLQKMQSLVEISNKQVELIHRIAGQKDHADLHRGKNRHTCPECQHSWVIGVDDAQYAQLVESLKQAEQQLVSFRQQQTELQTELTQVEAYFEKYREIMGYTKTVVVLRPFWEHLIDSSLVFDAPMEAVNTVRYLKQDLLLSIKLQDLEEKIEELSKLRIAAEEVGDANLTEVKQQMEVLTQELGVLTAEVTRVARAVESYGEYRRQLNTGLQLGEEVKKCFALAHQQKFDHVEALRRESILHCLREVENTLSLKQESLRAVKRQKELVELLKDQVAKYEVQEQAAKTMVKALSPTHGLIAEGLLGFIRNFVGQMNTFLNRVWKYPLQVIPTGYDNENGEQTAELDYKFKVMVEREDNIIPDVSRGSEGIKDILDLAFKIVAIQSLGLSDTPLMLDEPGRTFDDEHRVSLTEEIRWMMENGNFPQLFMVSHHSTTYSAFTNAQMCVIDDRNVVIPSGRTYNEHVKILH